MPETDWEAETRAQIASAAILKNKLPIFRNLVPKSDQVLTVHKPTVKL